MVMVSPTLYCGLERAVTLEEGGEGRGAEEGGRRRNRIAVGYCEAYIPSFPGPFLN